MLYLKMRETSNKIVSIVIVTGGIKDYLESCLDSLENQTYTNLEVIVIDNSLNQNFSRKSAGHRRPVKLYSEPKNLFYAGALNKGINLSRGEFILCLNDDVILDRQFIQEALRGFLRRRYRGGGKRQDSVQRWQDYRQHRIIFKPLAYSCRERIQD